MSGMRLKTVRRVAPQRTTGPDEKLRILRALYMIVYNDEESLIPLSTELFHALGEILEGIPPEDLDLHRVNKEKLLKELQLPEN